MCIRDSSEGSAWKTAEFELYELTSFEIDIKNVGLSVFPGGAAELAGSNAPVIRNTGNTPIILSIKGTDFVSGSASLGASSVSFSAGGAYKELSTVQQDLGVSIAAGQEASLSLRVSVPSGTQKAVYMGRIHLSAASP